MQLYWCRVASESAGECYLIFNFFMLHNPIKLSFQTLSDRKQIAMHVIGQFLLNGDKLREIFLHLN